MATQAPEIDQIIKEQNDTSVTLQQAISNYKKSPIDRKTTEYVEKKQKELEALWLRFQRIDKRLRDELPEKHPYFDNDLYKIIGEKYYAVQGAIENDLRQAKAITNKPKADDVRTPANIDAHTSDLIKQKKVIHLVQQMINQVLHTPSQSAQFYKTKLDTIEQHWRHVNILHERLWTCDSANYNFDEFITIEESVNKGIITIQELIDETQARRHVVANTTASNGEFNLPRIDLPNFDGNYLNWRNFHDLFSELVDKRSFSPCQKLLYLKSTLSGEAKRLIQHFATTSANAIAWNTLNDRYENKRILVNTLLQKLLSCSIPTTETVATLKLLHDTTHECLKSLQNLGISTSDWDPLLLHILIQKLHRTTHMLWEQTLSDPQNMPSLEDFFKLHQA